jgi:hypothetical protein
MVTACRGSDPQAEQILERIYERFATPRTIRIHYECDRTRFGTERPQHCSLVVDASNKGKFTRREPYVFRVFNGPSAFDNWLGAGGKNVGVNSWSQQRSVIAGVADAMVRLGFEPGAFFATWEEFGGKWPEEGGHETVETRRVHVHRLPGEGASARIGYEVRFTRPWPIEGGATVAVELWYDPATLLPSKRSVDDGMTRFTETYTRYEFDGAVDEKTWSTDFADHIERRE